jgi:hypothetical protein
LPPFDSCNGPVRPLIPFLFVLILLPLVAPDAEAGVAGSWTIKSAGHDEPVSVEHLSCMAMESSTSGVALHMFDDNTGSDRLVSRRTTNNWGSIGSPVVVKVITNGGGCTDASYNGADSIFAAIYDASTGERELWRTNNTGTSWTLVQDLGALGGGALCVDSLSDGTVVLGHRFSTAMNYYLSTNYGATWSSGTVRSGISASHVGALCGVFAIDSDNFHFAYHSSTTAGFASHTHNTGGSWTHVTITSDDPDTSISMAGSGTTTWIAYPDVTNDQVKLFTSTNGGTSYTGSTVTSVDQAAWDLSIRHITGSSLIIGWCEGTPVQNINGEFFIATSDDGGANWTISQPFDTGGFNSGYCSDSGSGGFVTPDPLGDNVYLVWGDTLQEVRVARAAYDNVVACVGNEYCRFPLGRTLVDVRTSWEPGGHAYALEIGSRTRNPPGDLHRINEAFTSSISRTPCTEGSVGVDGWIFLPEFSTYHGLAVGSDGRVVVTCQQGSQTASDTAYFKTFSDPNLGLVLGQPSAFQRTPTRMEVGNVENVVFGTNADDAAVVNLLRPFAIPPFDIGNLLGGVAVDPRTNMWAVAGSDGFSVFQEIDPTVGGRFVFNSTGVSNIRGVALSEFDLWTSDAGGVDRYTFDGDDYTLDASVATLGLTTYNKHQAIRASKDQDYVYGWIDDDWTILNGQTLATLSSGTARATIKGCDLDVLNNFILCVSGDDVERFPVFDDLPTVWGLARDAFTESTNTTVTTVIDENVLEPGSNPFIGIPEGGPDIGPGALPDSDSFLGVPIAPAAEGMGVTTGIGLMFFGLLMVIGFAFTGLTISGNNITVMAIMAGVGFLMAFIFGLFPVWMIGLLIIIGGFSVVTVASIRGRGAG